MVEFRQMLALEVNLAGPLPTSARLGHGWSESELAEQPFDNLAWLTWELAGIDRGDCSGRAAT